MPETMKDPYYIVSDGNRFWAEQEPIPAKFDFTDATNLFLVGIMDGQEIANITVTALNKERGHNA